MKAGEHPAAERDWNQRAEYPCRDVTVELVPGDKMRGNSKGGRVDELLRFRTGELLLG